MRNKNYILSIVFTIFTCIGFSQESVLCSKQTDIFKIENSENIPVATLNGDDTYTLTFPDQSVTDVFADYTIYNFFQAYPNTSETLEKYYKITFNSRGLIESMITSIPGNIIEYAGSAIDISNTQIRTSINPELIQALDGNTYDITKYVSTSDDHPCNYNTNCELDTAPEDFNFRVNFYYNPENELLTMGSENLSSCENEFSITLTGGNPNEFGASDNTLQLWESISESASTSQFSQPCHNIEATIFALLGIACPSYNYTFGNISVTLDSENESLRFIKSNQVFGYHIVELSKTNLSVEDQNFHFMNPFETQGNPYLQIANFDNQLISLDIYNTSGQNILQTKTFEENSLDISNLPIGLYFIKLSNLDNQQKIFKFLKN